MTQISFVVLFGFQNKGKTRGQTGRSQVSEKAISKTSERPVCPPIFSRNYPQFVEKLRYIHRNPVKAGVVRTSGGLGVEQFSPLRNRL